MAQTRGSGLLHPTDVAQLPPRKITSFLLTGTSSAQASDWLSSGSTAEANAAAAGVSLVKVTGMTTAGGAFMFTCNWWSSGAIVPSSGDFNTTTSANAVVATGPVWFQISGASTGFSLAAFTSGRVIVEQYKA